MKIQVTSDDGIVIETIEHVERYNLDDVLTRIYLWQDIRFAVYSATRGGADAEAIQEHLDLQEERPAAFRQISSDTVC